MSAELEATAVKSCCASCGKAEGDDIKLKKCACNLAKYCSVECQKNHRPKHKKECKKRAAEIRDDKLFRLPDESHLGECPLCCLPLSLDYHKWGLNSCCCKAICFGCCYANMKREKEQGLEEKCPFCREPFKKTHEEIDQNYMKRVKANDPVAIRELGKRCRDTGDYNGAFEHFTKAAGLDDAEAHLEVSVLYRKGHGVEVDLKKELFHLEKAAIGGHPWARHNLGADEWDRGRYDRAAKHFIISAKQGYDNALEMVKNGFRGGVVSKEDYEAALRGHQAAVDATKSQQREEAEKRLRGKVTSGYN